MDMQRVRRSRVYPQAYPQLVAGAPHVVGVGFFTNGVGEDFRVRHLPNEASLFFYGLDHQLEGELTTTKAMKPSIVVNPAVTRASI
jgi:hypothetical protein